MNKVALFDFCETLANFQTADAFVNYVASNYPLSRNIRRNKIRHALQSLKIITVVERLFPKCSFNKRLVLWQLKGYNLSTIENASREYYFKIVKPNLIAETIERLRALQDDGWRVLIVSAGYETYLKWFCQDFDIEIKDLIAVKIKFNQEGVCLGCFDGGDRLWDKVDILSKRFESKKIQSIAFSDGLSDLPMLMWADEGVVVRKRNKTSWNEKLNYNFKEIIWDY